ncbi:MAG: multicopper oxidase domain-containing protein, partial [Deltaproteobacteria bacterium]|nr:multicopper oxidase domain-containing protein [Deltaproteobacteria bacterium]
RHYDLRIQHISKNITGVESHDALAINGQIPAPTLRFKKGDTAVTKVINETHERTTLHWHGVLVPWDMDGPAFSNNKLIEPGESFTFKFPIKQTGTYWYHSHAELQEQRGLYGAFIIEDEHQHPTINHDQELVLSDWSNEHAMSILHNLKKDGDYYGYKKDFLPSIIDAIRRGSFGGYLKGEWDRMGPMDLSDVGYDAFLINGEQQSTFENAKPGDKIRFRIINSASSSYFYINIGNLRNFTVISKDGIDIEPITVNELLVAIGETYDILFQVPNTHHPMAFELRSTAQDVTGYSSLFVGSGSTENAPDKEKSNPYVMKHEADHVGHKPPPQDMPPPHDPHGGLHGMSLPTKHQEAHSSIPKIKGLHYGMIRAKQKTEFNADLKRHDIRLQLSGDMNRYQWMINGKPFSEEKYIHVKYNEVVRFTMVNTTMMHHPMHLHGHFFRVINEQGAQSPLFHTVDVAPMSTVTIEFHANEPGIWFFHCHNLFHMMMGMARLIKYDNFEEPMDLVIYEKKVAPHMIQDDDMFWRGNLGAYSNHAEVEVGVNAGRYDVTLHLELDEYDPKTFESQLIFKRYLNIFFAVLGGAEVEDEKLHAILGLAYTLPLRIETRAYLRTDKKIVVTLKKEIPITGHVSLDLEPRFEYVDQEFEWEFETTGLYNFSEIWSAGLFYKRDENNHQTVGVGVKIRF